MYLSISLFVHSETVWFWQNLVRLSFGSAWGASSCLTEVSTGATSQHGQNSSLDKLGPKPPAQSLTKSRLTFKKMVSHSVHLVFMVFICLFYLDPFRVISECVFVFSSLFCYQSKEFWLCFNSDFMWFMSTVGFYGTTSHWEKVNSHK